MAKKQSRSKPDKASIAAAIESLLAIDGIKKLVRLYFEPSVSDRPSSRNFAGHRFDSLADNPENHIVASDLVAVSLLDVTFRPEAVDVLLADGEINKLLVALPDKTDLWKARQSLEDLYAAYGALRELHDVGPTKASKLLARKRSQLAPITDRHVERVFACYGWEFLAPLADCLAERSDLVTRLQGLNPNNHTGPSSPSVLRLLDVAIWMTQSGSKSAEDARHHVFGYRDSVLLDHQQVILHQTVPKSFV